MNHDKSSAGTDNPDRREAVSSRRGLGELENEVMSYLWAVQSPVTPSQVHQAVAPELAYTTVTTVLNRLWNKELLERSRSGRTYTYNSVQPEALHRAEQMHATLDVAADRAAVLSSFIESLNDQDAAELRALLDRGMGT